MQLENQIINKEYEVFNRFIVINCRVDLLTQIQTTFSKKILYKFIFIKHLMKCISNLNKWNAKELRKTLSKTLFYLSRLYIA